LVGGALFLADTNRGRLVIAETPGLHQQLADGSGLRRGGRFHVILLPLIECEPGVIGLREQVNGAKNNGASQGTDGDQWRCYYLLACGAQGDVHLITS